MIYTIDFETEAILPRPKYPPKPVGVAIKPWGKTSRYYSWAHPMGNNTTWDAARNELHRIWDTADSVVMHNGKFDIDVGETFFNLPRKRWDWYHDTLFLLFLNDPHAQSLSLKPSAERLLEWPPDERDAVNDWLVKNQPVPGVRITPARAGAYISKAPASIVGPYACGDVDRTEALFKLLFDDVCGRRGMREAYDRERRLMPVLLDAERRGLRVDTPRLERDCEMYRRAQAELRDWIRHELNAPDLNIDSSPALASALVKSGKADESAMGVTPTGKLQTNKDALDRGITDRPLYAALRYDAALDTCLGTFMEPWLESATNTGGLIHTEWRQVRSGHGDDKVGARTGRLSSSPNFQNMPKEFKPLWYHERHLEPDPEKAKLLPRCPLELPTLPRCRQYITPYKKGHILLDRDYSQQELRILAHFENGPLKDAYLKDPWLDIHELARQLVNGRLNANYKRKHVKNTVFGIIYGMGVGKMAEQNDITVDAARSLKKAILDIFPGLKRIDNDLYNRAKNGMPIRTWGGREYFVEPPKINEKTGEIWTFEYKLLNVLIQGSAGDCTKESMIRYAESAPKDHLLLLTVHDELLISVPARQIKRGMNTLREAMELNGFDVPMLSEGTCSRTNWVDLKPYDEKGVLKWSHTN